SHVSFMRPTLSGSNCLRPYHTEHARSRPISEAKQCRAWLVLGCETGCEYQVLSAFLSLPPSAPLLAAAVSTIQPVKLGTLFCVFFFLSFFLPVCLSVCLCVCLCVCLPVCLHVPSHVSFMRPTLSGSNCLRPYHTAHARSRPISDATQSRALVVLGWETAWEYQVLSAFLFLKETQDDWFHERVRQ